MIIWSGAAYRFQFKEELPFREGAWAREEIASSEDFEPVLDGAMVRVTMIRMLKEKMSSDSSEGS